MPVAKKMMGAGISAGAAHAICGDRAPTVSAAGTTAGTATVINAGFNLVTTVAANSGVICQNLSHSDSMYIYNAGANPLAVYPPTSGNFNQLSANSAITLAINTALLVAKVTDTQWIAMLSA